MTVACLPGAAEGCFVQSAVGVLGAWWGYSSLALSASGTGEYDGETEEDFLFNVCVGRCVCIYKCVYMYTCVCIQNTIMNFSETYDLYFLN